MSLSVTGWIVLPLVGAAIGYLTNRLAVRMIFRPIKPVKFLGIRIQGLIGRRQPEIAASIGRVVGSHLLGHQDLVDAMGRMDLEGIVDRAMERRMQPKIDELKRVPLVGAFLTDERVGDLRRSIVKGLVTDKEGLVSEFERAMEEGLDVQAIVTRKVSEFPIERLESLILEVASRELRSIEILGGVLGGVIGLVQAFVLSVV